MRGDKKICACGCGTEFSQYHKNQEYASPKHRDTHKREQDNYRQRERRRRDKNKNTKKYEKTRNGFLMRCYRNMLSRVMGIQKKKAHLYEGLHIMPKEKFKEWAINDEAYNKLHDEWVASNYDKELTPSIDRINGLIGYIEDNVRFVTKRENDIEGQKSAIIMRQIIKELNQNKSNGEQEEN